MRIVQIGQFGAKLHAFENRRFDFLLSELQYHPIFMSFQYI